MQEGVGMRCGGRQYETVMVLPPNQPLD